MGKRKSIIDDIKEKDRKRRESNEKIVDKLKDKGSEPTQSTVPQGAAPPTRWSKNVEREAANWVAADKINPTEPHRRDKKH